VIACLLRAGTPKSIQNELSIGMAKLMDESETTNQAIYFFEYQKSINFLMVFHPNSTSKTFYAWHPQKNPAKRGLKRL
jgi:hypothetical protein